MMSPAMRSVILIGLLSQVPLQAVADARRDHGASVPSGYADAHDHERAREARLRGEIQPIARILHQVGAQVPGEVIGVELEQEQHAGQRVWIYELKILAPDGRRREVEVDARDGRILELEDDD